MDALTVDDLQGMVQSRFLRVVEPPEPKRRNGKKRKTRLIELFDTRGILLAQLKWHSGWRTYTFWPTPGTLWDVKCLEDVGSLLHALRQEWLSQGHDIPDKQAPHCNPATRQSVF